ncbi:outer membrane lipoprotein LolB [Alloalcanivorax xenomutans]|uniref:lipoprotein insertase outer membrane protein LolB n=1 Tax=Alloalcanivorax xenomutans TaxID=1094342 RepID=UPI000BCF6D5B|nr:lipoprotein insertase outer membrane protein LolB [Alloalcanivorax xenomutans]SOC24801.1 outer membrane lipoprotein LolB [Alloalcanivorax xenomutans]
MIRVAAVALALLLTACQQQPVSTDYTRPDQILKWRMSGKLGYRTEADGGSATFDWHQTPRQGEIQFSGPLGFGSAELRWDPGLAHLRTAKGEWQARTPGELAWHLTGFWLPVSALEYWSRGLVWPGAPAQSDRDQAGNLITLNQLGWQLQFDRYQPVGRVTLPHRIKAEQDGNRFTLLIRDWRPLP